MSRSVATNSWLIYGSRLLSVGLAFLTVLAIARSVGPRGTGEYAVGVAAAGILIQVGNGGLSTAALYFAARRPRRAGKILSLAWVWSGVILLLGTLAVPSLTGLGLDRPAALLVAVWAGLQMAVLLQDQLLLAVRQFVESGVIQVTRRFSGFLLTVIAVLSGWRDVRYLFGAAILGDALAIVAGATLLGRRHVHPATFPRRGLRPFLALGLRAFPVLLLPYLLFRSDVLLLKIWRGAQETGVYAVAAQVIDAVLLLPAAFGGVLFVAMTERRETRAEVRQGVRRVLLPVALTAIVLAAAGPWLLPALFGRAFEPAYAMMLLLLPGAIAIAIETQVAQYFAKEGFPWFLSLAWLGGLVVNLGLNLFAIPRFGGRGAAVTSTVAYILVTWIVMRRYSSRTGTSMSSLLARRRSGPAGAAEGSVEGQTLMSFYPLSGAETAGFEDAVAERLTVSSLRIRSFPQMWRELRRLRRQVTFALTGSDEGGQRTLADVFLFLVRSERKAYFHLASRRSEAYRPGRALAGLAGLAMGTLVGAGAVAGNFLDARRLGRTAPRPRRRGPGPTVAYLRSSAAMPAIGGSVGHSHGIISRLAEAGHTVTVFAAAPPCVLPPGAEFRPVPSTRLSSPFHELNLHSHARRYHRLVRRGVRRDTSFLYQRYVVNDLSGVRLARDLGVPLVLEFNGSEVWVARHWSRPLALEKLAASIEAACLRSADLVVTVSRALGDEALRQGVAERRLLVYPNGVDPREFDPGRFRGEDVRRIRTALGVSHDAVLVTHVGTFAAWHGTEVLARAILALPDTIGGRPVHFLFVGDGLRAAATRALLQPEIARGRVTMAGSRPQSETPGILAASDVLVSPQTRNEDGTPFFGSPTKLFEYMAMGKIVVASDLDQLGEVLRGWVPDSRPSAGASGLLAPPGDPAALAAVLGEAAALSMNPDCELGIRARRQVVNAFTWKHHVGAILERLGALDEGGRCAAA